MKEVKKKINDLIDFATKKNTVYSIGYRDGLKVAQMIYDEALEEKKCKYVQSVESQQWENVKDARTSIVGKTIFKRQ